MITIQHQETEKSGVFEAWMRATEEGACTDPVQVGEMTYQRPTPERMIIDHTRVFDGFEGKGIARQMVLAAVDFARANNRPCTCPLSMWGLSTCRYVARVISDSTSSSGLEKADIYSSNVICFAFMPYNHSIFSYKCLL